MRTLEELLASIILIVIVSILFVLSIGYVAWTSLKNWIGVKH